MKLVPIVLAIVALAATPALPTGPVAIAGSNCPFCTNGKGICSNGFISGAGGKGVKWADHHNPADARFAINTENDKVTLLLTDRVVAVQLSEKTLHKVQRELRQKRDEQDHWLGEAIVAAVVGTVGSLIDSSFECRIRDIQDVRYRDGRLEFIGRNGRMLFDDADVDGDDFAASFSERDAKRFVEEFRKAKAGLVAAVR